MIPEIDIWRVANLMLKRHGDETTVESAKRTDDLAANGNAAGRCQSGIGLSGQSVDGNVDNNLVRTPWSVSMLGAIL